RAEDAQPLLLEGVDDAGGQGVLRADHGQADLIFLGEADELVELVSVDRDVLAVGGGAGVARGAVDLLDARRLRQLPDQGVLAPALADDQHLHATASRGAKKTGRPTTHS